MAKRNRMGLNAGTTAGEAGRRQNQGANRAGAGAYEFGTELSTTPRAETGYTQAGFAQARQQNRRQNAGKQDR